MTVNAFVIGSPIRHSRSPLIHRHWLQSFGIDGSYEAIEVTPEGLPAFIARLRAGAFAGGNVTIPLKQDVLAHCDHIDADAAAIGSVNTLVMRKDGLHGRNTDMQGFLDNLDRQAPGWDGGRGVALVLGAGGAARAILVGLARRGFAHIHILNRTPQRAAQLAAELPGPFTAHPLEDFGQLAPQAGLLVNTSAVGMHNTRFDGLPLEALPPDAIVADIVYTPLVTPLLADAGGLGLKTVDGLGMLLHQAGAGFAAWFGVAPQVTPELRHLVEKSLEAA